MAKLFASTIYRRPSLTFCGLYSAWFCSLDEIGSVRGSPGSLTPVSECFQSPDCQSEFIRLRRTGVSGWVYTLNVSVQWWITDRENNSCLLSGADWPTVVYRNCLHCANDCRLAMIPHDLCSLLYYFTTDLGDSHLYTPHLLPRLLMTPDQPFNNSDMYPCWSLSGLCQLLDILQFYGTIFVLFIWFIPGLYRPYRNLAKSWVFVFVLLCLNRCIHLIEDFQSSMAHSSETLMV